MNKGEFVVKLAEEGKISRKQAEGIYSIFVGAIATSLQKGERVAFPGLGSFSVVDRKARTGRNPRTGAAIKVPAKKAVKFSTSTALGVSLNPPKKAPAKTAKKAPAKKPAKKK